MHRTFAACVWYIHNFKSQLHAPRIVTYRISNIQWKTAKIKYQVSISLVREKWHPWLYKCHFIRRGRIAFRFQQSTFLAKILALLLIQSCLHDHFGLCFPRGRSLLNWRFTQISSRTAFYRLLTFKCNNKHHYLFQVGDEGNQSKSPLLLRMQTDLEQKCLEYVI